jgi:hypothetical protein
MKQTPAFFFLDNSALSWKTTRSTSRVLFLLLLNRGGSNRRRSCGGSCSVGRCSHSGLHLLGNNSLLRLLLLSTMQSRLGNGLVEHLTLDLGKLELLGRRLAGSVGTLCVTVSHLSSITGMRGLTAKVPAPQGDPPRTSDKSARMGKACLYPSGTKINPW